MLRYHDIGDYLTREEKLEMIADLGSVAALPSQVLRIDASGDWLNQRSDLFQSFSPMGDKKDKTAEPMFGIYSLGVVTNRERVGLQLLSGTNAGKHAPHDQLLF